MLDPDFLRRLPSAELEIYLERIETHAHLVRHLVTRRLDQAEADIVRQAHRADWRRRLEEHRAAKRARSREHCAMMRAKKAALEQRQK